MTNGFERPFFGRQIHGIQSSGVRSVNPADCSSLHDDSTKCCFETKDVVCGCGCYESTQEALDLATLNLSFALPPVLSFNVACITAMAYNNFTYACRGTTPWHFLQGCLDILLVVRRRKYWIADTARSLPMSEHLLPLASETHFPPCQNRWQLYTLGRAG
jgi:hypothetical protein